MLYANGNPVGGGGGGTGGHTIIDENGNSMTARAGLQFVGADVEDDGTNNKTIVDLASAGGIDGVFIDTDNVIVQPTSYTPSTFSYTATEDCALYIEIPCKGGFSTFLQIDGVNTQGFNVAGSNTTNYGIVTALLKKGQVATLSATEFPSVTPDYAVYGIQTGTTHSKFQPVIYSTEEREIGAWTDGKPLYQKTLIDATALTGTSKVIDISSLNAEFIQVINCELFDITSHSFSPVTWFNGNNNYYAYINSVTNSDITIGYSSDIGINRGNGGYVITIQYTKTTDVAGSGTWTPQGVPAEHYSTDEQIIGTYFGDTLYLKTIVLTSDVVIADSWTTIYTNALIGNIAQLVDVKYNNVSNKGVYGVLNFKPNGNNLQAVYPISGGLNVLTGARFILKYTKSS